MKTRRKRACLTLCCIISSDMFICWDENLATVRCCGVILVISIASGICICGNCAYKWVNISYKYRVIHKFLRDFRPLRYSSRDCHAEGEHVNRGRDTPSFCPTLQLFDISILGDAGDVNPLIKFLPHTLYIAFCPEKS